MSYHFVLGVSVRCDDCHAAAARGEQLIGVWPGTDVERSELPGWHADGHRHRCPDCARRRECAGAGHRFGTWTAATEGGRVPLIRQVCAGCGAERAVPAYSLNVETSAPLLAS